MRLMLNQRRLNRISRESVEFYSSARVHQGLDQRIPIPPRDQPSSRRVFKMSVFGGLHHDYRRAA